MARTVWYLGKYTTPQEYGFTTRTFLLAREFALRGIRTIVFSSDSNHLGRFPRFKRTYTKETIDGVDVWWLRTLKYRHTASVRRVLSWIDFELKLLFMPKKSVDRLDAVIASSLSLLTVITGYLLKLRYRCTLVFEVRDIWPLTLVEEGGFSRGHPFVRLLAWIERFGYRNADLIVGTMPNLSEHVAEVTGSRLPCHCIPFGYDPDHYAKAEPLPESYESSEIPKGKFIVAYAGSIGISNALDTLIEASKQLVGYDNIHFLLVGSGDLRQTYQIRTSNQSNITFAPRVEKAQVNALLSKCDLLYFSAHKSAVWRFGQSLNKIIDYMMAGKPIVGSYSGFQSMINEANCGTCVSSGDAEVLASEILAYARMPSGARKAIGERGRTWMLKNRTYPVLAGKYLGLMFPGRGENQSSSTHQPEPRTSDGVQSVAYKQRIPAKE